MITRKRQAKANGNAYVDGEPKLALVIRIRGINQISPRVKKILQLLRLRQIGKFSIKYHGCFIIWDTIIISILGNATFVKLNKATNMMLNIAQLPGLNFDSLGSVGCSG